MLGVLGLGAAPPLFRARVVRVELSEEVRLTDVRQDGRAIGTTTERWRDGWQDSVTAHETERAFAVFGGEGAVRNLGGVPYALTGVRSFAVRVGSRFFSGRIARERDGRGRLALGELASRPRAPRLDSVPILDEWVTARPEWRAAVGNEPAELLVEWRPLRGGIKVGSGAFRRGIAPRVVDPDPRYALAFIKQEGRIGTLAARTLGAPKVGFGDVLYVSRQGWLVVALAEGRGLAWLEPVSSFGR